MLWRDSTRECHLDGDERVVSLDGHGLQVARDAAIGFGVVSGSETPRDFLLDLGHSQIALSSIVGKRTPGICCK